MSYFIIKDKKINTIRTLYLNFDYYKKKPTYNNLSKMYEEKINGVIKLLGMTPLKWDYEYKKLNNTSSIAIPKGRFASYEGYPFRFYIKRVNYKDSSDNIAIVYAENNKTKNLKEIFTVENYYGYNNSSLAPEPPKDFLYHNAFVMIELVKDEGGGIHFTDIRKYYNNKHFSTEGYRESDVHIVPIYDISQPDKVFYGIATGNDHYSLFDDLNTNIRLPSGVDSGTAYEATDLIFVTDQYQGRHYRPMKSNQAYLTNVGIQHKQYTIGLGARCAKQEGGYSGKDIDFDTADTSDTYATIIYSYCNNRVKITKSDGSVVYIAKMRYTTYSYRLEDQNF